MPILNRKCIFKWWIFHCYVRLPECKFSLYIQKKKTVLINTLPDVAHLLPFDHPPFAQFCQDTVPCNLRFKGTRTQSPLMPESCPKTKTTWKNHRKTTNFFRQLDLPVRFLGKPQVDGKNDLCKRLFVSQEIPLLFWLSDMSLHVTPRLFHQGREAMVSIHPVFAFPHPGGWTSNWGCEKPSMLKIQLVKL